MKHVLLSLMAAMLVSVVTPAATAGPSAEFAARFVQTRTLPGFEQPLTSHGELRVSPEGGFRWEITEPYHYLFAMHDGKAFEELPNGTRRVLKPEDTPWLKMVQRVFVNALSGQREQLERWFEVTVEPLDPGACRTCGIDSENSTARGQISDDSPADSGSIGQEAAGIWTAQADLQPVLHKSDRLLGRHVTLVPTAAAMAKVIERIEVTESQAGTPRQLVIDEASGARMTIRFTPIDAAAESP